MKDEIREALQRIQQSKKDRRWMDNLEEILTVLLTKTAELEDLERKHGNIQEEIRVSELRRDELLRENLELDARAREKAEKLRTLSEQIKDV